MTYRDATSAEIDTMIQKTLAVASARTPEELRLVVQRLRSNAADAPAYPIAGVCYPASALLDCAAKVEALYAPSPVEELKTAETKQVAKYQTELRTGVAGNGNSIYLLYVLDGARPVWIHKFLTKAEAMAFHASATQYGPLEDQSY